MIYFDLCGGSTKGAGISAYLRELLESGYKPDIITSVSYSSYIAVPVALYEDYPELMDKVVDISTTASLEDFMRVSPVNKKGGFTIRAIFRLLRHILTFGLLKPAISAGVQDLSSLIDDIIPEHVFKAYQNGNYAEIYVSAIDYKTRKPVFWNIKDKRVTYDQYKKIMDASGTMPFYTQGSVINGRLHFDTGVTDQNAGCKFLEQYKHKAKQITEVFSLYSRPYKFRIPDAKLPKNSFDVLTWMLESIAIERSMNDEKNIKRYCEDNNIKWSVGYLPWIMKSFYDTDPDRLEQLKNESIMKAKWFLVGGVYE